MRRLWLLILLLMLAAAVYAWLPRGRRPARNVFILGVDGLDHKLLQQFVDDGSLPHFKRLISKGDFKPLKTTMPPLSPVAWSTFVTGMDPGGHAIFDFVHRDPKTLTPDFSMARAVPASWVLNLGSWALPLKGGSVEQLRRGKAFWDILEEHHVPTTIYRMPVIFLPPTGPFSGNGHTTSGTLEHSFYTDILSQRSRFSTESYSVGEATIQAKLRARRIFIALRRERFEAGR
jgi:hypothetical protein